MATGTAKNAAPNDSIGTDKHLLQLHQGDQFLAPEISRVLCVALDQGYGALSIARPALRQLITSNLQDRGVDIDAVKKQNRYVSVDATTVLARFMRQGQPDERRFVEVAKEIIDPLCARFEKVSVFGEMVAVLWESNEQEAALRLEQLWTDFVRDRPVLLYCSYPPAAATDPAYAEAFRAICAEHCRVLHATSPLARSG